MQSSHVLFEVVQALASGAAEAPSFIDRLGKLGGRLHPLAVHFPIALIALACLLELWRGVRRKGQVSSTALVCLGVGAMGACAAAGTGWLNASYETVTSDTAEIHRWVGVGVAGLAVMLTVWGLALRNAQVGVRAFRLGLVIAAGLVAYGGHLGGVLTHGETYVTDAIRELFSPRKPVAAVRSTPMPATLEEIRFPADGKVDFDRDVKPIFVLSCVECHGESKRKGGLRMDGKTAALAGGKSGPLFVAGKPDESQLIIRVLGLGEEQRMPADKDSLPEECVRILRAWVEQGAIWPDEERPKETGSVGPAGAMEPVEPVALSATVSERASVSEPLAAIPAAAEAILYESSEEGVFRVRRAIRLASLPAAPNVPDVRGPTNNEIDRFILAAWMEAKLPQAESPPAVCDDGVFIRRVYLDVIGVVPTVDELDRFAADTSADKRTRLIDELLDRHADYADHWTPFWEDALGSSYANLQGGVPTRGNYRKWINDSFRQNKAFDLFAAELIDSRMPGAKKPEIGDANGRKSKIAYIRNETHTDTLQSAASVAQVFMGTSVKCASCHGHFENEEWPQRRALAYSSLFAAKDLELIVCEKNTGEAVPAAFCFDIPGTPADVPSDEEGRLRRAAQLLTDPHNPRFARAIVNRLWKRYLGLGLVEPVDDFRADVQPSHPELLDWLAHDLARHDFNLKRTIRLILTSRTYQLRYSPELEDHFDVANKSAPRYFRSPSLRRLTAEQVVDSIRVAAEQRLEARSRLFHVNESTALSRVLGKPASRNEISTARADDAAVVQSLELLNGEEFGSLVYSAAILNGVDASRMHEAASESERIIRLYRAVLSRPPTAAELESAREYVSSAGSRSTPAVEGRTSILIDDQTPEHAREVGEWNWTDTPVPPSGGRSRVQRAEAGKRVQHYVLDLPATRVAFGDTLFVWVRLDPRDPPRQIMIQWNDGVTGWDGGWAHRAYWGEDLIPFGQVDSASRRRLGALPAAGEWVRLSVPASVVGFSGAGGRIVGVSFDQHGGTVHWDAAGVVSGVGSGETEALGDVMWALVASPEFQYVR